MNGIFLLLGTNLGDRERNLNRARLLISDSVGEVILMSSVYETAPWGIPDQPVFYNQVIGVKSTLTPRQLLDSILEIEHIMGRKRIKKWSERLIDIDILYYNDLVIEEPGLSIPHPGIMNRRFTLVPLSEIAPEEVHPVIKLTQRDMLDQSPDAGLVTKLSF